MNRELVFRSLAETEIDEAVAWYASRSQRISAEFVAALEAAIASVYLTPEQYPIVAGELRRALLQRFPYGLIYLFNEDEVIIVACAHTRQDPRRWRYRR